MSLRREIKDDDRDEPTSQFAHLLEVETRLASELENAQRRAAALVATVKTSARERERRLALELESGFPELEKQIRIERDTAISALISSASEKERRFNEVDQTVIDRLAADLVNEVLGTT